MLIRKGRPTPRPSAPPQTKLACCAPVQARPSRDFGHRGRRLEARGQVGVVSKALQQHGRQAVQGRGNHLLCQGRRWENGGWGKPGMQRPRTGGRDPTRAGRCTSRAWADRQRWAHSLAAGPRPRLDTLRPSFLPREHTHLEGHGGGEDGVPVERVHAAHDVVDQEGQVEHRGSPLPLPQPLEVDEVRQGDVVVVNLHPGALACRQGGRRKLA